MVEHEVEKTKTWRDSESNFVEPQQAEAKTVDVAPSDAKEATCFCGGGCNFQEGEFESPPVELQAQQGKTNHEYRVLSVGF